MSRNVERMWTATSVTDGDDIICEETERYQVTKSLPFLEGKHRRRHSACRIACRGEPRSPSNYKSIKVKGMMKMNNVTHIRNENKTMRRSMIEWMKKQEILQ